VGFSDKQFSDELIGYSLVGQGQKSPQMEHEKIIHDNGFSD
jgi:hypothetical protein